MKPGKWLLNLFQIVTLGTDLQFQNLRVDYLVFPGSMVKVCLVLRASSRSGQKPLLRLTAMLRHKALSLETIKFNF